MSATAVLIIIKRNFVTLNLTYVRHIASLRSPLVFFHGFYVHFREKCYVCRKFYI
jgi:hypothetical protein